jgi:hypothetical protein
MDLKNVASLTFFLPEMILSVTILLLIVLDLFAQNKRSLALIAVGRMRWRADCDVRPI